MNMLAVGVLETDPLMSIGQETLETKNLLLAVYFASLVEKQKQDTVSLPSQKVRLLDCSIMYSNPHNHRSFMDGVLTDFQLFILIQGGSHTNCSPSFDRLFHERILFL